MKLLADEINPYMEQEIALVTKEYEWKQIQKAAAKKAEADRIAKEKADNEMSVYHGFMKDATPVQKGKVRKTLSVATYDTDKKTVVTRAQFVEHAVAEGRRIEAKKGAKRTEYRIYNKSNSYYTVTKTEYDYAMYLLSNNQQETKKATESGVTEAQPKIQLMAKDAIESEINYGRRQIEYVMDTHQTAQRAMYVSDIGEYVDFRYGREGNPSNDYADGFGLSHIFEKHGQEALDMLPEVLAKGKVDISSSNERKKVIRYGDYMAIIKNEWNDAYSPWVVTNYGVANVNKNKAPSNTVDLSLPSTATSDGRSFTSEGSKPSLKSIVSDAGNDVKPSKQNHKKFIQSEMLNMVKTEFPSAKNIKQDGDSISFTLNGQNVKVNFVDHVVATEVDKEAYKRDYGKEYNDSVEILGKTETTVDGTHILTLLKSGNKDTISHKAFHLAFRAVLNEDEQKALLDKYGDEEAIAEAYRKLMGKDNSRGTMFDMTTKVGRLFQKIWNFAKSMFGLLDRGSLLHDTDSILYAIADGSIYDMAEGKKSIPAYLHPMYTKLMTAWHGSPNKFDKFSTDFMGSGEGQQAWGWGLYFALNRATSEDYILQLSPTGGIVRDRKLTLRFADGSEKELYGAAGANYVATEKHLMDEDDYTGALDVFGYYSDDEINEYLLNGIREPDYNIDAENIANQILMTFGRLANSYQTEDIKNKIRYYLKKTYSANVREGSMSKSLMDEKLKVAERLLNDITDSSLEKYEDEYHNLYKVDIPDINTMLRTDIKGLEQPKNVQTALESIVNEIQTEKQYSDAHKEAMLAKIKNMRGKRIYRLLVNELGSPKAASLKLLEHGVEGISYTGNRDGDCCVVFNDKAVKILERNGKPVESNTDRQGTKLRAVSDKDKFSAEGGLMGESILLIRQASNLILSHLSPGRS